MKPKTVYMKYDNICSSASNIVEPNWYINNEIIETPRKVTKEINYNFSMLKDIHLFKVIGAHPEEYNQNDVGRVIMSTGSTKRGDASYIDEEYKCVTGMWLVDCNGEIIKKEYYRVFVQ